MENSFHSAANATDDKSLIAKATKENRFLFRWLPYVIAACLMVLVVAQLRQITLLKSELLVTRADATRLQESNALTAMRLTTLEAKDAVKDASYASSKILVAWDPYRYQGVVAMQNLPTPPTDQDYQLWVLDPAAAAPISAGLMTGSRPFTVRSVSTLNPGFAVSLEPVGGSPEPTGPILFAVAPGP